MASLNLSINGPSIKSSYNGVVSAPPPSSNSPTYAQWALLSVQAPLMNAFQDSGAKESILKVESTGDGELTELIEDFNEGRIQFAFVKVKDPNTTLPKCVLIAWCGGGVPERTKGYFTSHAATVSKVLHGYHVQITARSDSDLEVDSIMKKVSDASGAKYSAASSGGTAPAAPPPFKSKPVFTPTASSAGRSSNPLVAARARRDEGVDDDGWGADAPPVTRTEIQKVESAYRPTKVNMAELTKQQPEALRFDGARSQDYGSEDVIKGSYRPVGKVDIAAIRAAAKIKGDDRPTPVKGTYEPVGKVDIAAIRAKAQRPADASTNNAQSPKPVADPAAGVSQPSQSERISALPKPKVANKFGGASVFTGTKAHSPGGAGFGVPGAPGPAPVGNTSRTFADEGGKTPAQIWAEKKARQQGSDVGSAGTAPLTSPVAAQKSGAGEWKSGYTGKSWAPVQTPSYGRAAPESVSQNNTGEADNSVDGGPASPSGEVSALRDRFKNVAPIGSGAAPPVPQSAQEEAERSPAPPHAPDNSRPSGGFALPGLPSRPPPPTEDEDEGSDGRSSPIRVAAPVPRSAQRKLEHPDEHRLLAPGPLSEIDVPREEELPDEEAAAHSAREAAVAVAGQTLPQDDEAAYQGEQGGKRAVIQYDYEKAEDNEIELVEGEYVTNIDMVDDDWWMGTNSRGERGLFPSNYVELVGDDDQDSSAAPTPAAAASSMPEPAHATDAGPTATALYDYEAAEDNELSFPEDATITKLEFPDEDWWFGSFQGQSGLFPANYVQLDS
ncbi:actin binding protein [Ophiocordyceps sinensis CO18]|uniref:Actin binding protein n=1 Tax=Ophiocordyceps sinensis (strain Co18 / CGMCC 3.14243) TaxID=911162 RepID=T4ZXC3_OPHSC|nr:actin binding protein [Ophiocordyceps sinensis CO18]